MCTLFTVGTHFFKTSKLETQRKSLVHVYCTHVINKKKSVLFTFSYVLHIPGTVLLHNLHAVTEYNTHKLESYSASWASTFPLQ